MRIYPPSKLCQRCRELSLAAWLGLVNPAIALSLTKLNQLAGPTGPIRLPDLVDVPGGAAAAVSAAGFSLAEADRVLLRHVQLGGGLNYILQECGWRLRSRQSMEWLSTVYIVIELSKEHRFLSLCRKQTHNMLENGLYSLFTPPMLLCV